MALSPPTRRPDGRSSAGRRAIVLLALVVLAGAGALAAADRVTAPPGRSTPVESRLLGLLPGVPEAAPFRDPATGLLRPNTEARCTPAAGRAGSFVCVVRSGSSSATYAVWQRPDGGLTVQPAR